LCSIILKVSEGFLNTFENQPKVVEVTCCVVKAVEMVERKRILIFLTEAEMEVGNQVAYQEVTVGHP
jgi:hypothetical protein